MTRYLITVFVVLISLFSFCVPVSAKEPSDCVSTECLLALQGFTPEQVKTIEEIRRQNFQIELQIVSGNGEKMVVIMPNGGGFLLHILNKKGKYELFALIP